MNLRQLSLIFVIAALVMACSQKTPETEDVTDATGQPITPVEDREYALSVTYAGGLRPAGQGATVFSTTGDTVTYANYGADGAVERIQERTLSAQERRELKGILDDVDALEPFYGDGSGDAADAGRATVSITRPDGVMTTIIDPNTEEAYPPELDELMVWVRERTEAFSTDDGTTACTGDRPENCIQIYDPVCGDNGRTYSNSCVACADAAVGSYSAGEC